MAIENELSIPSIMKRTPATMADITNNIPTMDSLLKSEFVDFTLKKAMKTEIERIRTPFIMCAKTSIPPEYPKKLQDRFWVFHQID